MSDEEQVQQPAPEPGPTTDPGQIGTDTVIKAPDLSPCPQADDPGPIGTDVQARSHEPDGVKRT